MEEIDIALAALADPTRRRVIEVLIDAPRRTGELAEIIGVSVPAVSRHLRVLRDHSLIDRVDVEGDGRGREYRLAPNRLAPLASWLNPTRWAGELAATAPEPDAAEFLSRVGGFLDGFANSDISFFERHLADDVTLVFPGADRVWDRESTIASVADHAPYVEWRVSDASVRTVGPDLTLVTATTHVRTTTAAASSTVIQSMLFDDTTPPWRLRLLHQSSAK